MTLRDELAALSVSRDDRPERDLRHRGLDEAGVPSRQRVWIVAAGADDETLARLSAAIADAVGDAVLAIHDPREPDDLIFQRRVPGQRRGGIYLNHHWQQASCRVVVGDAEVVAAGLSAWFNGRGRVFGDDLGADIVVE